MRIYLDFASVTPIDPGVRRLMNSVMKKYPANPSSLYQEGVLAKKVLEKARLSVATSLEAHADEIIFTSGGTEANNIAIVGVVQSAVREFSNVTGDLNKTRPHVISLSIEHPSVREVFRSLEHICDVTYVEVDNSGIVDPKHIREALRKETVLVSVMYANNEIGTIQPISEIAKTIRHFKKEEGRTAGDYPFFHTDASQAASYCSLRTPALNVDLLTLDGGKIYGPRGVGVLYARRHTLARLTPIYRGGGQEQSLRPGTENLPAIAGLALALEKTEQEKKKMKEIERVSVLRERLLIGIKEILPHASLNGSADWSRRLPNNVNICIPNIDAELLVLRLDAKGICVSSVTSCRASAEDSSSYVIESLGKSPQDAVQDAKDEEKAKNCSKSSLRITLGRTTTKGHIDYFLKTLKSLTAMLPQGH